VQVAKASGLGQPQISNLETAESLDDHQLSTVRRYLQALGDDLELVATSKLGHRIGIAPPARRLTEAEAQVSIVADDPGEAIKVRAQAASGHFRRASEALSDTARMATAAGADAAGVLRKLALLTKTVHLLVSNVTGGLIGMGPTPLTDLALVDALEKVAVRELRKPRSSSSTVAIRKHPMNGADLVRDLRAVGLSALPLSDWYSGAEDASHPLKYGAPPSGKRRVTWLAEVGWLTGPIEGLVLHVVPMMRKHGHLLGKQPPADLKERLTSELEGVRARRAKDEKKDVDSYLLAVFRAYGFKNERCSGWLKTRPR
jgi:transcriptional regulator with XRE-family HTH domain